MNETTTTKNIVIEKITLPPKLRKGHLAKLMGISVITLNRRMRQYGITATLDNHVRATDARRLLEE